MLTTEDLASLIFSCQFLYIGVAYENEGLIRQARFARSSAVSVE